MLRPRLPPRDARGLPVADPSEERIARAVVLVATVWFALAAGWELFGPLLFAPRPDLLLEPPPVVEAIQPSPLPTPVTPLPAAGPTVKPSAAAALRERGVPEPTASVTAETALATFRVAFERWVAEGETRSLAELQREALDALRAVATGR